MKQVLKASEKLEKAIIEEYTQRTPRSAAFDQQAKKALPGGDIRTGQYVFPYPTYMEKGKGCHIWDYDGNQYIDFNNNASSMIHGHCFAPIVSAAKDQMTRGTAFGGSAVNAIRLADILESRVPSVKSLRFANSGSEATMFAIRALRAFSGRDVIVKMDGGYNGAHDTVEFNVSPDVNATGLPRVIAEGKGTPKNTGDNVIIVPFNDLEALEGVFRESAGKIAAVVMEPMMFGTGMVNRRPGYLQKYRDLCDRYGVLLMFDEVVTFRASLGGYQVLDGVQADMTAFGKIMAGGFPGAAFGGRKDIMDLFDPAASGHMSHSGTFNGNNFVTAAGIAALTHYDQKAIDHVNLLGDRLRDGFTEAIKSNGLKGCGVGYGSMVQANFGEGDFLNGKDYGLASKSWGRLRALLHFAYLARGVHAGPRGFFAVSTVTSEKEVDKAISVFDESLSVLKPYIEEVCPHILA
jgi:glutamate-1-semialdehyde 2,1-aminomutase